jgi:hypothetical protein
LSYLTLNDAAGAILKWVSVGLGPQEMHGVDDGRERVTKFVTEHRQEFVLATVQIG